MKIKQVIAIPTLAVFVAQSGLTGATAAAASQEGPRIQATRGGTIAALVHQPHPGRRDSMDAGRPRAVQLPEVPLGEAAAVCGQAIVNAVAIPVAGPAFARLGLPRAARILDVISVASDA